MLFVSYKKKYIAFLIYFILLVLNFVVISYSTSQATVTKTPLSRIPLFLYCDVVTFGFIPEDGTDTSP